jgi:nitrilase
MRHIAKEGRCWILSSATAIKGSDVPLDCLGRDRFFDDDTWVNDGDAVVVAPKGKVVAGPLSKQSDILYAEIDVSASRAARKDIDVSGHYYRPDIFKLEVDRRPLPSITFINE